MNGWTQFREKVAVFKRDADMDHYEKLVSGLLGSLMNDLQDLALLLLKPEFYLGGDPTSMASALHSNGFHYCMGFNFEMTVPIAAEIWKYEPFMIGADRIEFVKLWAQGPAFAAILRHDEARRNGGTAASVLTRLKGGSRRDTQEQGCLRACVGQDISMLSHLHTADEPLDLVRELGVILTSSAPVVVRCEDLLLDAFGDLEGRHSVLNARYYDSLVGRLQESGVIDEPLAFKLNTRTLSDWAMRFRELDSLARLSRKDRLVIAAANCAEPPNSFLRQFPSVRHGSVHGQPRAKEPFTRTAVVNTADGSAVEQYSTYN